jgi:hypothetical protein
MSEPSKNKFLITLSSADGGKKLTDNEKRPFQSNFVPLEIRVQRSAKKKDPMAQECRYISSKETEYPKGARCYIQIWELDTWAVEKKKGKKKVQEKVQDKDGSAKKSAECAKNDFLAEFGGFIKEIINEEKKEYKFITDGKETTIPKAPADKKLGKLILRIDELRQNGQIYKKDIAVPIQGEVESILEIGVAYQDKPNQQTYTDNYTRPVYPIVNISKIIEEQLKEGGLRVICYVQLERDIDTEAHDFYKQIRESIPIEKQKGKKLFPYPSAPKLSLEKWLSELKMKEKKPSEPISTRKLFDIQNDRNFKHASGKLEEKFKSLRVDDNGRIIVGRILLVEGKQEIVSNIKRLIDAVYEQHMESKGEKPKVFKLGIYCHGSPNRLMTGGRIKKFDRNNNKDKPDHDYGRKEGGDITKDNVDDFVSRFVVKEEGKERKLPADNIVFALYACSTGRSSYTDALTHDVKNPDGSTTPKSHFDNTFGKDQPQPPGKSRGEGSFARALRDKLHLVGRFPNACVHSHTTAGDADANPYIRRFYIKKEDDIDKRKEKNREVVRDTSFMLPPSP